MEREPLEESRGHKRVRTPSPELEPDEMNEEEEEQFGNYMEEYKRVFNLNRLGDERAEKRIYNRAIRAGININNTGDFLDWLEEQIEDRLGINNVNTENNPPDRLGVNNPPEQEGEGMFHKQIKELERKLKKGEGIIDFGKDLYDKAKHIISTATKLNNTSRKTLEKFGNQKIKNIIATREVVQKAVTTLINLISGGHLDKEKNKMGYDDFFHIRLYCEMENGTYILLEKNEVVFIYPKGEIKGEKLPINYKENSITLNDLVNKTMKYMGEKDFYSYDAFTNNCASFVIAILKANGLWSEKDKTFLLQDVKHLKDKLPKTKQIASYITQLGAIVSRARGKGIYNFGGTNQELQIETNKQGLPFTTGQEIELGTYDIRYRQLAVSARQPKKILLNIVGIFGEDKQNQIFTEYNENILVIQSASIEPSGQNIGSIFFNLLMKFFNNYIDKISNIEKIQVDYEGAGPQSLGFYINTFAKYGFYLNGIKQKYKDKDDFKNKMKDLHNKLAGKMLFFTKPT